IRHAQIGEFDGAQRSAAEANQWQHQRQLAAAAATHHHDETLGAAGRGQMPVQTVQPERMLKRGCDGVFEQRCVFAREKVERIVYVYVELGFRVMHALKQDNQCRGPTRDCDDRDAAGSDSLPRGSIGTYSIAGCTQTSWPQSSRE